MEEERQKKLKAGQEMFAEKRKRLQRRSQQQLPSPVAEGASLTPSADDVQGDGGGPGHRGASTPTLSLSPTSDANVSQPASSESVSFNTSQSSAASSASPNYCQKPASNESISNGMDAGLNNSYGSSEVSFSSDLPKKDRMPSAKSSDTSVNEALSKHKRKIGEMQRELARREDLIRLLSGRLEEALRSREQVQREASVQEQQLATEISSLKLELTTCMQLLAGQQTATGGTATDEQVASLQQALQCRDEQVAQLQQQLEAQEQQITVLQDIRADLLGRLTTVPVSTEQSNLSHGSEHLEGNSHSRTDLSRDAPQLPSDVSCRGDAPSGLGPLYLDLGGGTVNHSSPEPAFRHPDTLQELPSPFLSPIRKSEKVEDWQHADENLLLGCKEIICRQLSDWITARSLSVDNYRDIVAVFNDIKQFAVRGLHYCAACESAGVAALDPSSLLNEVAALQFKVAQLEEEVRKSADEVESVRIENASLRKGSLEAEEALKVLRREHSLVDSLSCIKESEYKRAKEEVEGESLLEVYELQTECIRLEQEKKALQQRTRLLSGSDRSPTISPVPPLLPTDRVRHNSAVQTDAVQELPLAPSPLVDAAEAAIGKVVDEKSVSKAVDEKLSMQSDAKLMAAELEHALNELRRLGEEKGAYDALVVENVRISAEKERAENDLAIVEERLKGAEDLIEKLRHELDVEHSGLEVLVARTEELLGGGDAMSDERRTLLENQSLKCQVALLSGKLEREQDFSSALKSHVQCLVSRDKVLQKTVKDLTNRLLSSGEKLRKSLEKCRETNLALMKSSAQAECLEAELKRLKEGLLGSSFASKEDHGEGPFESKGVPGPFDEKTPVCEHGDSFASYPNSYNLEGSVQEACSVELVDRLRVELDVKEMQLRSQELELRSLQQLELCDLRVQLHREHCLRLADVLSSVRASCHQELVAFQRSASRNAALEALKLKESHQGDIAALKRQHKEQLEQLRSRLHAPEVPALGKEEEVLEELRLRQQRDYEQLLPRLDPELQVQLQGLVALTLKIHHVETEQAMARTQERMTSEKNRLVDLLSTCNQVDREALEAKLEHDQKLALRDQYQAFLDTQERSMTGTVEAVEEPPAFGSLLESDHTVEGLLALLRDRLNKQFYTSISKLSGEWRDKYMSVFMSETDPQESPAENMSHEVIQGLKKHLECASEAEQLINSFHNLSDGMRKEILSTLEETLRLYHKLSKETNAASELERYRSLYEQLSSGAPLDLESLHQKQDLQLKTLRASLEERFSQEKTLLLSEQVTRTKELLNRHEADLKAAEESAEARMAAERRRWMEELDVLRSCFLEKEEEGRKREAKMADDMAAIVNRHGEELQKRDAKMADDVAAIADRHNEELQKLCAALEEERQKAESLRDALGVIEHEREQLASLTEDIQTSSGEEDFVAIVQSVLEENKKLKDDVKSVRAEYEGRALKIQQRVDEVEAQYKQKVEELVLAQSRQEEVLKAKDEDMQLLRHELEHYADSVEALKQEHEAQLQELKERLRAEYAELAGSLNVEGSDIGSLKDALHTAIESVRCDHETEIRQIRRNLDTEHNLIANSIMAQYDLDLEALKNRYEGQLSALREQHSAELQRLASERVCAVDELSTKHAMDMQQLKLDLEGYYNEVVASLRKEGAAKVKELEERLQNGGGQKAVTTCDRETETSEAEIASVGEVTSAGDANEKEGRKVLNVADPKWDVEDSINVRSSAKEVSPEWSDVSVEDILYERTELTRRIRSLTAVVDQLQAENRDLKEQLNKANELSVKEARASSRSPREWLAGSGLTANEIQSWQLHTAQTNTRLLNVLSDLVKTYVDTEQDIQDALAQLGLSRVDSPDSTAVLDEDYSSLGAVSSQTHGSKEDFAEGFLSELCEDGPDLTPRTWDMFASAIGMQETAEMEGEDVVLGASRRLRTAVDRVLKLLGEVAEHRGEDFRSLVQRNRDLCQELRQESQLHNQLCMDLINAQGTVRSLELEKQKLEETVFALEESRTQLERELRFAKAKVQRLEDAQDDLAEERLLLREQRSLLQEGLQEPQLRLLEEHTRLSEEKRQLQRSQDQEKQGLLCRVGELEAALEEACLQREEVLEMRRQELADLQAQIDAMDKQLLSHKKFIEEQTHEREQEREESAQEICQLQEALRDKEKIQNCEQRLSKEIECLEQQLKMRLEDHALVQRKRDQLEDEVRSRDDKIHDLRDIIRDLESELATRSRAGHELTQKVSSLQEALAEAERAQAATQSELERMKGGSLAHPDLHRHVQQLEEQLESRSLELEKMAQFQSLLLEFRTQVRSLEDKVQSKIAQHQDLHVSQRKFLEAPGPLLGPGRDGALLGTSEEGEGPRPLSADDIRDLSPSALQWQELRGLEEKVDTLSRAAEELFRERNSLRDQLRAAAREREELEQERQTLQEHSQRQLLQMSALKAHVEDCRLGLSPAVENGGPVVKQLRQLRHDLLIEKEAREDAEQKLQLSNDQVSHLQRKLSAQSERAARQREAVRPCRHVATLTSDHREAHKHQATSTSTGVETELTLEQVGRLEEALSKVDQLREEARETTAELEDLRATCKIHKNDIESLNAAQDQRLTGAAKTAAAEGAKLAEDFEEVHSILEEREQEILELQQEAETQVVLEAEVQSLRDSLAQCRQAHAEELAMLQRELQRCQQAHEADVHRLHQHMEEAQCLHAQVQETLRQEVVALRDHLLESMPRDEATAALNKAVAVERENQQTKHHEEIRLLEETWSGRLDAERQRLQREQLQKQTDLERKYQQHARAHSWNRTDFEKEMAAQLEHEMAALNVQHQDAMEGARRHWDEEKRALRVAHAEELQRCLEQLRASLAKAHQEEVAELKRRMRDAAKQHEAEMQRAAKSWEERIREERRTANEGTRGHPDAELAELWSRGDVREFLGRRVNEEVSRLQQLHVHEVAVLRKALEKREADAGVEATSLRLEQEHTTEVARLRSEMAEMLREEEQALNAKAAQHMAAAEAEFRLEKERLVEKHSEEMRQLQAEFERESSARDAAHREQLQRVETNVKGILEAERGSARLQREQLVWKLQGQHADEVKALRCAHQQELASVKDELDRAKLKLRARKISALVQSRGGTPVSDNGSSSVGSGGTLEDRGSQDSVLSPPLRNLLNKIYRDQLHVLSMTERQLLQRHLTPSPERHNAPETAAPANGAVPTTTMETQHLHQQLLRERAQHMQMVKELQQEIALHREQAGQKERKLRDRGESQEGQLRLERARSEELQRCLDTEVSKSLELLSQLNSQRSSAMELEMALASSRSDLMDARRKILAAKQDALHFKGLYEVEKEKAQSMLMALNAERAHFNQQQATAELERRRTAINHERDLRIIKDLKSSVFKHSVTASPFTASHSWAPSEVERLRGGDLTNAVTLDGSSAVPTMESADIHVDHRKCAEERLALSQSLLKAEEEISRLRELALSAMDSGRGDSGMSPIVCKLLHKLYWKYRKTDSLRKGLAYQKQYLLGLLQGFQATEELALRMMGRGRTHRRHPPEDETLPHPVAEEGATCSQSSGSWRSPRFRFRSAVLLVVALHRMRHLVHKWRLATCIPPVPVLLHKVELAVRTVPMALQWRGGASGSGFSLGTAQSSQSSVHSSGASYQGTPGAAALPRRTAAPLFRNPSSALSHQTDMKEYVVRLESLHKQFGLSDQ
ncbi:pericentrin [Ixodes scapularis]|uniref:pericentrin n=1 Tax=Ixodes scapularis TaxID=6945 RepID=UPI001C384F56|nr:pericentrin [Ixodes scapularis]